MVTVYWYEHSCEWLSKYCDEHHKKSARVPQSFLTGLGVELISVPE